MKSKLVACLSLWTLLQFLPPHSRLHISVPTFLPQAPALDALHDRLHGANGN